MAKNLVLHLILISSLLPALANEIILGPYLQKPNSNSVMVKWQTNKLAPSIIEYSKDGKNFYTLEENFLKKKHKFELKNLELDSEYQYSIFTKKDKEYQQLEDKEGKDRFSFKYKDPSAKELKVWVLGDPGVMGDFDFKRKLRKNQLKVKEAFLEYLEGNKIEDYDFILALGDNAYSYGTYEEYKHGFFQPYADELSSHTCFSAFGNHDAGLDKNNLTYSARSYPHPRGVYYRLFSMPGKEAYYSFDRGDAHFIVLDSFDSLWEDYEKDNYEKVWTQESKVSNSMLNWLKEDLKQNKQTWTVVAFHHPPFGQTEYSDEKTQDLWKAWTNAYIVPLLDKHKVDLVLMGHVHNYQRSFPLKIKREDLDRSKLKPKSIIKEHKKHFVEKYIKLLDKLNLPRYLPVASSDEKTTYAKKDDPIYVIMGSSGAAFKGLPKNPDPNFPIRSKTAGSGLLEINGTQLSYKFIADNGSVLDQFSIQK